MQPLRIIPKYKLLLIYDIRQELNDSYYRYVIGEFIPAAQELGLYMYTAWHTAYGNYPMRRIELVADGLLTVQRALQDKRWRDMEERLKGYTENYSRRLLRYRDGFQV